MPELPEVEIIRLGLKKKIIGLEISSIEILNPKSFQSDPSLAINKKVTAVLRRAKVLGIQLSPLSFRADARDLYTLVFHLKMSGQVILVQSEEFRVKSDERFVGGHPTKDMLGELPNNSTRVIFTFSNGSKLFFNDQRKFGWIKLVKSAELRIKNYGMKNSIGPEPLEKDFNWEILKDNLLKRKNLSIKVALLDQTIVAGVGNIYASESCFNAKVDPLKKVKDLTQDEFKRVYKGVVKALSEGLEFGGSTRTHFVNAEGKKGLFLDYAGVYNREGQKCKNCEGMIIKVRSGGRSTFFCKSCQN